MVRLLSACAHAGGAPAAVAGLPLGVVVARGVAGMFETFSGAQVAELCFELGRLARRRPRAAAATAFKLTRTIRRGLARPALE